MEISTSTFIIWFIRIALPAIFFVVWYRGQPKDAPGAGSWKDTGPTGGVHSRKLLLAARQVVKGKGHAAPSSLSNMKMVDEEQCPRSKEFAPRGGATRRGAPGGKGGGREKGASRSGKNSKNGVSNDQAAAHLSEEERVHLDALLNASQQQANGFAPPKAVATPLFMEKAPAEPVTENGKTNREAQNTLNDSMNPGLGAAKEKCGDSARDLFKKLTDDSVEVEENTFSLMIEACLYAGDLKGASDFLLKMETAGFCPDSRLLDKVMDLYSSFKGADERGYDWAAEATAEATTGKSWDSTAWMGEQQSSPMITPMIPSITPTTSSNGGSAGAVGGAFNFDAYSDDE